MLQAKNNRFYLEGGGWETDGHDFKPGDRIKLNLRAEDLAACADKDGWVQIFVARRPDVDEYAKYTHSVYYKETKDRA
jgi:hypothetical protein